MAEPQRKPPSKVPVQPQAPVKQQAAGKPQAPLKPQVPVKPQVPGKATVPVKPAIPVKPQTPVKQQTPIKPQTPLKPKAPLKPEEDVYAVSAPVERVMPTEEEILFPYKRMVTAVEEPPPPPAHFLSGVLLFPWHLQSVAPWMFCSIGLALSLLGVTLAVWLVDNRLSMAAYAMKFSICWVIAFTLSYLSGCILAIIEGTAAGWGEIEWPHGDWREVAMTMRYPIGALVVAAVIGTAADWATLRQSWAVPLAAGLLAYPFILLSAMENGSVMSIVSGVIARTYLNLWWGWLLVYALSGAMFGGWLVWALWYFPDEPFFTAGISGPILAAMLFVYARLMGRVLWWSHEASQSKARRKTRRAAASAKAASNPGRAKADKT